jgi:hypothetical protein
MGADIFVYDFGQGQFGDQNGGKVHAHKNFV